MATCPFGSSFGWVVMTHGRDGTAETLESVDPNKNVKMRDEGDWIHLRMILVPIHA